MPVTRDNPKTRSRVSLRAVAKAAGVSVTTASRVLNNNPIPTVTTRNRVLEAASTLNYQPDPTLSQAIRRRRHGLENPAPRTGMIGLLVQPRVAEGLHEDDPHYSRGLGGIQQALSDGGQHLVLHTLDDPSRIPDLVRERRLDGVILWVGLAGAAARYVCRQMPTVLIEDWQPDWRVDSVMANAQEGMQRQLAYLWDMGHRRIAYFEQGRSAGPQESRRRGFREFFEQQDVPLPYPDLNTPRAITPVTNDQVIGAFVEEMLAQDPRPTALVAGTRYALHLMHTLQERGIRVPEDLSIAGTHDDWIGGQFTRPALTVYRMPMEEVGRLAVKLLLERMEHAHLPPRHLLVDGHQIERASCGPPPT